MKSSLKFKDYSLVFLQLLLCSLFILDTDVLGFNLPNWSRIIFLVVAGCGALIMIIAIQQLRHSISPFPPPKAGAKLIKNGLYRYVRHPIYTGIILIFLGIAMYTCSGYRLLIMFFLYILFVVKSKYEEELLSKRYKAYETYKKNKGRFFPRFHLKKEQK